MTEFQIIYLCMLNVCFIGHANNSWSLKDFEKSWHKFVSEISISIIISSHYYLLVHPEKYHEKKQAKACLATRLQIWCIQWAFTVFFYFLEVLFIHLHHRAKVQDLHLPRFPMIVKLEFTHNHGKNSADALKHRDVSVETIATLKALFGKRSFKKLQL